jgi:hypothetical protein
MPEKILTERAKIAARPAARAGRDRSERALRGAGRQREQRAEDAREH